MIPTDQDAFNSVASSRQRTELRWLHNRTIRVRQADYENRESEFQRYLVDQRRRRGVGKKVPPTAEAAATPLFSSTSTAADVPPYLVVNGNLVSRRRYRPNRPSDSSLTTAPSSDDKTKQLLKGVTGRFWKLVDAIPSKYMWILVCIVLFNLRYVVSHLVSHQASSGTLTSDPPEPGDGLPF